jgi:transcriptional regulator with XRE-family HTH domain
MPETLQQTIAAFREVMQLTGWSQREISRRTGMTPSTICRILNGQITHTPCKKTRRRLGTLLAYVYRTQLCDVCNGTGIIPSVGYCPQCKGPQ